MPKFRKKPVVIEAMQYTGDNWRECLDLDRRIVYQNGARLVIPTLEGDMTVSEGDYIIKGIKGEFYPCKPDIFAATYEPAE